LNRLAGPAGVALSNVRLTYELRRRLRQESDLAEQLRRSRQRLVEARGEQRRRFTAAVDTRVHRHLAAAQAALAATSSLVDNAAAETLGALEALRDLAVGVFPLVLRERGLADALEQHVAGRPVGVTLCSAGFGAERPAPAIEAAAYFCCVAMLDDLVPYGPAAVVLDRRAGTVRLTVRSAGPTPCLPTPGTEQLVRDRVEAFGGTVEIRCTADEKYVTVSLPETDTAPTGTAPTGTAPTGTAPAANPTSSIRAGGRA
jgi:signal transduction histidine kinase